jgi:hypothetical protein
MFKNLRRSRTALVGVSCALVGAAVVPVVGLATISGSTGDGPMVVQSGETALTHEARANIASFGSSEAAIWSRVGDTVTQSGVIGVVPAAANANTEVYIPTAVDSNVNGSNCQGTASVSWPSYASGRVLASTAAGHTHQCYVEYLTTSASTQYIYYTMTYRVKN